MSVGNDEHERRRRRLIVNADDFGLSAGVNAGIIEAHERGIVTATSLMVRWPAAEQAATYARSHPRLDVGLHLDFGEWACCGGEWRALYEVVREDDVAAVTAEVERQLDRFRQLLGRDPTHVDSHQHVHRSEPARSIVATLACKLQIPLRHFTPGFEYQGDFYGQSETGESFPELVSADALITLLSKIEAGVTELGCHPARGHDFTSMYARERELEVDALSSPRVFHAIAESGIVLTRFSEVRDSSNNSKC
jgi:predicted glycoside hydrolase/deacetylase ChbG (UPF0249 family)